MSQKQHNHTEKVRLRIYAPDAQEGKEVAIDKEQIRHLKVLRVQEGQKIALFDGKGSSFEAVYTEKVSKGTVLCGKLLESHTEPLVKITLACAAPKGSRMDTLIEKVSELGVFEVIPTIYSRSVVEPRESKIERLQKIAIEACSQSERNIVPMISNSEKFEKVIDASSKFKNKIICHKDGKEMPVLDGETLILIGPEGDFTPEEIKAAEEKGFVKVKLANSVLRVETAAITAVAQAVLRGKVYK
jgi:16S rRNA (uracil1498-N3)-methyltransferase